jgi:glycine cleavage system aminomethyltransferase T
MALIDRNFSQIGQALFAKVRDRQVSVNVCALPFVPHRYRR